VAQAAAITAYQIATMLLAASHPRRFVNGTLRVPLCSGFAQMQLISGGQAAYRCRAKSRIVPVEELPPELLVPNVPDNVPTVIVEPELIVRAAFFSFTVPEPLLLVVTWPTTVPFTVTSSVLFAAPPVTVTDNFVCPECVFDLNIAVPVAVPVESVSCAVSFVSRATLVEAKVPLNVPTVTADVASSVVGKFVGNAC